MMGIELNKLKRDKGKVSFDNFKVKISLIKVLIPICSLNQTNRPLKRSMSRRFGI